MKADILWPAAFILGGALNFLFQYLILCCEKKAPAAIADRLASVRENFAERNLWAGLFCVLGFLWLVQELYL